jgi:methylmalonyl-CoA carboxyltransferase large subunit
MLTARVTALEAAAKQLSADASAAVDIAPKGAAVPLRNVAPEIVAVIAAVLAAHLGVRPHIRQVSLVGGTAWAQQGRVTIQASHALAF